jgi:hypothetical protein
MHHTGSQVSGWNLVVQTATSAAPGLSPGAWAYKGELFFEVEGHDELL